MRRSDLRFREENRALLTVGCVSGLMGVVQQQNCFADLSVVEGNSARRGGFFGDAHTLRAGSLKSRIAPSVEMSNSAGSRPEI